MTPLGRDAFFLHKAVRTYLEASCVKLFICFSLFSLCFHSQTHLHRTVGLPIVFVSLHAPVGKGWHDSFCICMQGGCNSIDK